MFESTILLILVFTLILSAVTLSVSTVVAPEIVTICPAENPCEEWVIVIIFEPFVIEIGSVPNVVCVVGVPLNVGSIL